MGGYTTMITGYISVNQQAMIEISVQGSQQTIRIDATIDTGYNGFLTLPPYVINLLHLPWLTDSRVILANGEEESVGVHAATIIWDGAPRRLLIDAADNTPLIGMALMGGYELNIQNVDNGAVTLRKL